MRLTVDTKDQTLILEADGEQRRMHLFSREAFEVLSALWLKVGWNEKYTYTFSWFGRPIIQLPEDLVRIQEVIFEVKPDVIVETGVAHGGSLVFYAGLCKAVGRGRVIGVDLEIRPANRAAIEAHELASLIVLVEGDSKDAQVVDRVAKLIHPGETVLVILDSNHSKKHVLAELRAYSRLVSPGSYIVATDGIMQDLADVPRGSREWATDNPASAAAEFASEDPKFARQAPSWPFNESKLEAPVTHWPGGWLRRVG